MIYIDKNDMRLIKALLKRDCVFSFKGFFIKNLLFSIIFIVLCLITIGKMSISKGLTDIYFIFNLLKGVEYFEVNKDFQFPIQWFFINFFICFNLGDNFCNDLKSNGKYLLIRAKNLKNFYVEKILLLIFNACIYYIIVFVIVIGVAKLFLNSSSSIIIEGETMSKNYLILVLFLLYSTTSITLVLLQNALSLIIKPKYSYLTIIILLVVSVFIISNVLPGQHSLILRHMPFDNINNLSIQESFVYNFILSSISIILGYIVFLKKDIF